MRTSWGSLEEFWADDPRRERSMESDYGVHWAGPGEGRPGAWPLWRVSYIQDTGEVYAACQHGHMPIVLLGVVPPDEDTRRAEGCYGGQPYYRTLNRILGDGEPGGWADLDAEHRELTWVTGKLAEAGMAVMT